MKTGALLITSMIACAPEQAVLPEPIDAEISRSETLFPLAPSGLTPSWRGGDAWVVRYHVSQFPSSRSRVREEVDYDWEYRVEWIADGYVAISATHLRRDPPDTHRLEGTTHLRYRTNAELVEVKPPDAREEVEVAPKVHFPEMRSWIPWHPVVHEWPQFPLVDGQHLQFETEFEQSVTRDGYGLHVTLRRHHRGDESDEEYYDDIVRTMDQTWEENRPWWSTVRVHRRETYAGGRVRDDVEIEGRVIEWRPAKP